MTVSLIEPATDWISQSYDERLRLCAETLFIHGLIKDRTYNHTTAQIRARAEIQGERASCITPAAAPQVPPTKLANIRERPLRDFIASAAAIVDSDHVIAIYAASEWAELGEDGKLWVAGIVREATARALLARDLAA